MTVDLLFVKATYPFFLDKGGANVNELDNEGNTPLMKLVLRGSYPYRCIHGNTERMVKAGSNLSLNNMNWDISIIMNYSEEAYYRHGYSRYYSFIISSPDTFPSAGDQ